MKLKDGFMLREVAGQWIVVPLGERVVEFNGLLTLSETGAVIWEMLEKECSETDLVQAILSDYNIDKETAKADIHDFVAQIKEKGLLE